MDVEEEDTFTHEDLLQVTCTALNELLQKDTFLSDLPNDVTLEEVNNQLALHHGRSITVFVERGDSKMIPVVVPQAEGTVSDLKKGIRRCTNLKINRDKDRFRKKWISWKYMWRTYHLQFENTVLTDNNQKLSAVGIKNKSFVTFVKRKRNKLTNQR